MAEVDLLKELEALHAAYNECSEHLGQLLNVVRETGKPDLDIMNKIKETNRRCDELLDQYVAAYNSSYGSS
jgi:hypothetical protein